MTDSTTPHSQSADCSEVVHPCSHLIPNPNIDSILLILFDAISSLFAVQASIKFRLSYYTNLLFAFNPYCSEFHFFLLNSVISISIRRRLELSVR